MKLAKSIEELTGQSMEELNKSLNDYLVAHGHPSGAISLSAKIVEVEEEEDGEDNV